MAFDSIATPLHISTQGATLHYISAMELLPGLVLPEQLVIDLVRAGETGHRVALSHHNDPGSNGYTFGNDRYHRTCELARVALERHGWLVRNHGAGYRARKDTIELWLATARTADVTAPSSFDTTTDSRRAAGAVNDAIQPQLDGLEELDVPSNQVVHVVFSGNSADGQVAVHVGRLISNLEGEVRWNDVVRVDQLAADVDVDVNDSDHQHESATVRYDEQPEPEFELPLTTSGQRVTRSTARRLDA